VVEDEELATRLRHFVAIGSRVGDRRMREKGVSLAQSRLMEVIHDTPRARWSDIAAVLGYSPRTITDALDGLERDGLITRAPDPTDRRARILTMTDEGTQNLAAAQAARDQVRAHMFGVLSDVEREHLRDMVHRMSVAITEIDTVEPSDMPN
jgi:DNA-binding MarR family transcriptional regulator